MASVSLQRVHKAFDSTPVVRGVSLSVENGEFLVLVGPSGCGKSTCLRLIAGLETVDRGDIYIGDRRVNDVPSKDRDIGMVFQSYALYPHLSVRENLAFALSLRKKPKQEIAARVAEVAAMLELGPYLDRKPKALSGGQRQRVAIGRALVRQPAVFLFDEPLSNLDAALRVQMRAEMASLHRRLGATMIYVTHDQVEAMTLADRIAVLHGGVVQQLAAPLELYQRPANRFVAGFMGSPAMNFIEGSVSVQDGRAWFRAQPGDNQCDIACAESIEWSGVGALGVRPQALRLVDLEKAMFRGEVVAVEAMGWESMVHVRGACGPLVVRCEHDGRPVRMGEQVGVDMDRQQLYVFDQHGDCVWSAIGAGR